MQFGLLVFPNVQQLDLTGPYEVFASWPQAQVRLVAKTLEPVTSSTGLVLKPDASFDDCPQLDVLCVPGGGGVNALMADEATIAFVRQQAEGARFVTSVCTGAALLARAGLLDGRRATTNKRSFGWVVEQGPAVQWVKQARWVDDGAFVTSSGVSAGIDMTLAVIARLVSNEAAERIAVGMEYDWHRDASWDPFAKVHGLV